MEGRRGAEELESRWAPSIETFLMRNLAFLPPQSGPDALGSLVSYSYKCSPHKWWIIYRVPRPTVSLQNTTGKSNERGVGTSGMLRTKRTKKKKIQPQLEKGKTVFEGFYSASNFIFTKYEQRWMNCYTCLARWYLKRV